MTIVEQDLGTVRRTRERPSRSPSQRRLSRPIEKVWAALTVPERIADWFAQVESLDLRLGGTIHLTFPRRFRDPRRHHRLRSTAPPRLDLAAEGRHGIDRDLRAGARRRRLPLTLTERGLSVAQGAGNAAGWHAHLEAIEDAADGVRTSWATLLERVKPVRELYKERAPQ
jgi:uncharacterized protein YndB with AHSA1/START domain